MSDGTDILARRSCSEFAALWSTGFLLRSISLIGLGVLCLFVVFWCSPDVRADGGAPNLAYVAGAGTGESALAIIDITQHRVVGSVDIGHHPAGVVLSTDGRYAYVTESLGNTLAIVDANARTVTASIPVGSGPTTVALDLSQTPNLLYVADSGGSSVTVVDPEAQQVRATIPVGLHPAGIAVALPGTGIAEAEPGDAEVYVANSDSDTVSVISTKRRRVIATIPAPGGPLGITIPQTGGIAYVSTRAGTVLALSLATHKLAGVVLRTSAGPLGTMDYDAVTGQVYVPDPSANAVDVLAPVAATTTGTLAALPTEPARVLHLAGTPVAVAITFEGSYGFVAQRTSGAVTLLDAATHQIQATISVGGAPQAIVTGPYPPSVSSQTALLFNVLFGVAIVVIMVTALIASTRRPRPIRQATDMAAVKGGLP
jgi:YVTN family beta-propeller protein